jgi:hypothetical protein
LPKIAEIDFRCLPISIDSTKLLCTTGFSIWILWQSSIWQLLATFKTLAATLIFSSASGA